MSSARSEATDGTGWGENFWITIVDPQVCESIYGLLMEYGSLRPDR